MAALEAGRIVIIPVTRLYVLQLMEGLRTCATAMYSLMIFQIKSWRELKSSLRYRALQIELYIRYQWAFAEILVTIIVIEVLWQAHSNPCEIIPVKLILSNSCYWFSNFMIYCYKFSKFCLIFIFTLLFHSALCSYFKIDFSYTNSVLKARMKDFRYIVLIKLALQSFAKYSINFTKIFGFSYLLKSPLKYSVWIKKNIYIYIYIYIYI